MGYSGRRFSASAVVSALSLVGLLYLVFSATIAMALMPVVGTGGIYVQADSLQADQGVVYPEYEPDSTDYTQIIGTTTPECQNGVPMFVVELDGDARATGFFFRKDVQLPFIENRWMSIIVGDENNVNQRVALSGENLKLFTTQFAGDSLLLRNVDLQEGAFGTGNKWGPESDEFILRGGIDTSETVPGVEGSGVSAWLHGATGDRVTLEPQATGGTISIDIKYPNTTEIGQYYVDNERFGYGLADENPEFDNVGTGDERVQRGIQAGNSGYFPCLPGEIPVE